MPTQKSLKKNLYKKNIWRISPPKKQIIFLPKIISNDSTQETLTDILC